MFPAGCFIADRQLAAQTAKVGVATADLYPKFRLFGSIGLECIDEGEILSGDSLAWSVGPSASWNIFSAGAVRRNIAVQSARVDPGRITAA